MGCDLKDIAHKSFSSQVAVRVTRHSNGTEPECCFSAPWSYLTRLSDYLGQNSMALSHSLYPHCTGLFLFFEDSFFRILPHSLSIYSPLHILPYIYLRHWYLQRSPGVYKGLYHWLSLSFETVQSGFSPSARLASNSLSRLSSGITAVGPHTLFPF